MKALIGAIVLLFIAFFIIITALVMLGVYAMYKASLWYGSEFDRM